MSATSSAAMTGWWRSQEPTISLDHDSQYMVTAKEQQLAKQYQQEKYPFAPRHFATRNRWFLERASEILEMNTLHPIVSLGSGFSLLTYHLVQRFPNIPAFDIDLPDIITERTQRIKSLTQLDDTVLSEIFMRASDLEQLHNQAKKKGVSFQNAMSSLLNIKITAPLFIMEGIIYFLDKETLHWIFDGIASYENAGIIFDYWAIEEIQNSTCYQNALDFFKSSITPQTIKSLLSKNQFETLIKKFALIRHEEAGQAEKEFVTEERNLKLTNKNQYIPAYYASILK